MSYSEQEPQSRKLRPEQTPNGSSISGPKIPSSSCLDPQPNHDIASQSYPREPTASAAKRLRHLQHWRLCRPALTKPYWGGRTFPFEPERGLNFRLPLEPNSSRFFVGRFANVMPVVVRLAHFVQSEVPKTLHIPQDTSSVDIPAIPLHDMAERYATENPEHAKGLLEDCMILFDLLCASVISQRTGEFPGGPIFHKHMSRIETEVKKEFPQLDIEHANRNQYEGQT